MYRLPELSDTRRKNIGWGLLALGVLTLVVAVLVIHYGSFSETTVVDGVEVPVVLDQFNWMPRGSLWKGLGYLIAFAAAQMLVVGALFVFVLNQKMTWARAVFAATVTWVELVLIFGMVPSEWLNFAQTDLNWSSQRVAVSIPPWLLLGDEGELSYGMIQDYVS